MSMRAFSIAKELSVPLTGLTLGIVAGTYLGRKVRNWAENKSSLSGIIDAARSGFYTMNLIAVPALSIVGYSTLTCYASGVLSLADSAILTIGMGALFAFFSEICAGAL